MGLKVGVDILLQTLYLLLMSLSLIPLTPGAKLYTYRTPASELRRGFNYRTAEGVIVQIIKVFTLTNGHVFVKDDSGQQAACYPPDTIFEVVADN